MFINIAARNFENEVNDRAVLSVIVKQCEIKHDCGKKVFNQKLFIIIYLYNTIKEKLN